MAVSPVVAEEAGAAAPGKNMRNVILIHGFNGIPKLYEWLKSELETRGVEVILPSFPSGENTTYENWAKVLDEYTSSISDDSIVVCHSVGNEFIIKYLAKNHQEVNTYIGLAGFAEKFHVKGKDILNSVVENFLVSSEEKQKFISLTKNRYAIYSDDDHIVPFEVLAAFPKEIDAKPILIPNIGHMGHRSGLEKLPELLDLILAQK